MMLGKTVFDSYVDWLQIKAITYTLNVLVLINFSSMKNIKSSYGEASGINSYHFTFHLKRIPETNGSYTTLSTTKQTIQHNRSGDTVH